MLFSHEMKKKLNKPVFIRLRLFVKGRVVSSQIVNTVEEANTAGSEWAGKDGVNTYAVSETKSPKI